MDKKNKDKRINNDLQNTTQKTEIWATLTPLKKSGGLPMCSRREISSIQKKVIERLMYYSALGIYLHINPIIDIILFQQVRRMRGHVYVCNIIIFFLDFGTVPALWYCLFSILFLHVFDWILFWWCGISWFSIYSINHVVSDVEQI